MHTIICVRPGHRELDLDTAPLLRRQLLALESPAEVLVDMRDVALCDSRGAAALLAGWSHQWEHGGSLQLAGTQPCVHDALTALGAMPVLSRPARGVCGDH